jgi:hypothetical protein
VSKFDAYWATFWGDSSIYRGKPVDDLFLAVVADLALRLGADIDHSKHKLPGGYQEAYSLTREGEVVCNVMSGGVGAAQGSHGIRVQGANSPEVASVVRELVPFHSVSRADVAEDYCAPDVFEEIVAIVEPIAQRLGVELERVGAGWYPHQRDKGRTLYVGSRKSAVFGRIYERGKKLLGEGQQADPNYVRVELEIKPASKAKANLCMLQPDQMLGASAWSRELFAQLTGGTWERIKVGTIWSKPDQERTVQALAAQYGATLLRLRDQLGDADRVFALIEDTMSGVREVKQARARLLMEKAVEGIEAW